MLESNFICPSCEKEYNVSSYSINTDQKYLHKVSRKEILCDDCKIPLNSSREWDGSLPNFGKVKSMSKEDRTEVLKKRSKAHFKKEILERKMEMTKSFNNELKALNNQ